MSKTTTITETKQFKINDYNYSNDEFFFLTNITSRCSLFATHSLSLTAGIIIASCKLTLFNSTKKLKISATENNYFYFVLSSYSPVPAGVPRDVSVEAADSTSLRVRWKVINIYI